MALFRSGKILKFLCSLQKTLGIDPVIILIIVLKSKDVCAMWGISPENYSIGNVGMKVGTVNQPQIMFWYNGLWVTVG